MTNETPVQAEDVIPVRSRISWAAADSPVAFRPGSGRLTLPCPSRPCTSVET